MATAVRMMRMESVTAMTVMRKEEKKIVAHGTDTKIKDVAAPRKTYGRAGTRPPTQQPLWRFHPPPLPSLPSLLASLKSRKYWTVAKTQI